jgi:predicted hydrocarbon binding protein
MVFKAPPQLLERVLRFRAIQHKEGRVTLWGIPAVINPAYTAVYEQRLLEKKYGEKDSASILYAIGKMQGHATFRMISERFGYAKTFKDKKRLLEFETGQSIVAGHGIFNWINLDFEKNIFIVRGISPHAEEYKRFFGVQKTPVDSTVRGLATAFVEEVINKKAFGVENRCIAMGSEYCEFVIKPVENWDKKDPVFKSQAIESLPGLKGLGAKIEPYIILKQS